VALIGAHPATRLGRALVPVAARLSQLDCDRERGPLAERDGVALGVAYFFADPDKLRAEYAVAVRSDWNGRGVGFAPMTRLIEIARQRGIGELTGEVLDEDKPMLQMCRDLDFWNQPEPERPFGHAGRQEAHNAASGGGDR
jgi:acetyltransferase